MSQFSGKIDGGGEPTIMLRPGMETCVVTIIDDDEPGVLGFFDEKEYTVAENCGTAELSVVRKDGADGVVTVHYETISGNGENIAHEGTDYVASSGIITFGHQELHKTIPVQIIDTGQYDKSVTLQIVLTNPGGGALVYKKGGYNFATVTVSNDGELEKQVNNLSSIMTKRLEKFKVSTATWQEQFVDAFECEGGDEDDDEAEPGMFDYIMHFFTIFWKVLFAFIPPTDYCGGWMTFFVSLCFIGIVTGLVGAVAEMFGCFVGLKDSVTAITFVALGTSLPDTFASLHAARDDRTAVRTATIPRSAYTILFARRWIAVARHWCADLRPRVVQDASIGNVTGSNSVNVFLGLGLPWVIGESAFSHYTRPSL